jgi:HPt (histidine-containing phosphotransfer) domain-containing protein
MIRLQSETGWWLVTHVDHAHLAGDFAEQWGNDLFVAPKPRPQVLRGVTMHDDGWAARDQQPQITRQGKPSAFSVELVGKYSAFEEIDLSEYLAVRERAVGMVAATDPYAALLVSMHTYNLLSAHADRSTIPPEQLPLLDAFLSRQQEFQNELRTSLAADESFMPDEISQARIEDHFHLLQACDNLSLLSCVNYVQRADLLHALPLRVGGASRIRVEPLGERHFRLAPYPFATSPLMFTLPARHVEGEFFPSAQELGQKFHQAVTALLPVKVTD